METKNTNKGKQVIGVGSSDRLVANNHNAPGIVRWLREVPPFHYILKIKPFSLFRNSNIEFFESRAFKAGGYKWKLIMYPNGNKKSNANGHISLYLAIADTKSLPFGWEINASFKLFAFDHIRDEYLTIQLDDEIRRFHQLKTEWGFDKFVPLDTFDDASNGYLVDDSCAFGAEVFVIKQTNKADCWSMIKNPANNTYTWKIKNISTVDKEVIDSDEFAVGDHKWKLIFYPEGNRKGKGEYMSLFLELADWRTLSSEEKCYAEYKLRISHQLSGIHVEKEVKRWFSAVSNNWGFPYFVSLNDLNNATKGYKVNDTVIVEAEITLMSHFKDF